MYGNHFTVFLLRCVNIYFITFKSIMHYSLFGGLAAHNHKFKTNFEKKNSRKEWYFKAQVHLTQSAKFW